MQNQNTSPFEPAGTLDYFKKAIEIVKLNKLTMAEVAADPNAIRFGIAVTAIGGALAFIPGQSLPGVLVGALFSIFVLFLFGGLVHLLCGYSKDKQEFLGFVRIVGLSGIIDWMIILPFTGLVVTLSGGKATSVVVISAMILWTISGMLFAGPLSFLYEIPGR
ncbi:MAG: hypothetical protein JRF64_11935 [Deltaproteobacteria bacterium]|nr:hypothetical protein [Deltaproteobacteria bacterium]